MQTFGVEGDVHDRMPGLLAEKDFEPWLSGSADLELLKPAPDDLLQSWPVSRRVNSSRASDEEATLIDRVFNLTPLDASALSAVGTSIGARLDCTGLEQ